MQWGSYADWFAGSMSGLASVIALAGFGFSEWQRRQTQRESEKQAGRQIGVKLFRVINGVNDIHRHLWNPEVGPLEGWGADQLWRRIHPLLGLENDPSLMLDAAETNLLVKIDQTDFMTRQMLLTSRHQSIVSSMNEYRVRYAALQEMMPPPVAMEGHVAQHMLGREEMLRLQLYWAQLETIVQRLRVMTAECVESGRELALQFNPMMKAYFKEKFMALEPLPAEQGGDRPEQPGAPAT